MRINILGVNIDCLSIEETLDKVENEFINKKPLHLMGVNADKINQCMEDEKIRSIVNQCEIINADGASVILASKYLGYPTKGRVAGIDLMQELLVRAELKKWSVYFFGAKESVVLDMINKFKIKYPNLIVSGYRNGYFKDDELFEIENHIRESNPAIVFVGITSPKKEYVIQKFIDSGLNSVFMGVGGSFDVLSGNIKRAPMWMQKCNLEWLFRVLQEPKRLFKRYFKGNWIFIKNIVKEKIKLRRK